VGVRAVEQARGRRAVRGSFCQQHEQQQQQHQHEKKASTGLKAVTKERFRLVSVSKRVIVPNRSMSLSVKDPSAEAEVNCVSTAKH